MLLYNNIFVWYLFVQMSYKIDLCTNSANVTFVLGVTDRQLDDWSGLAFFFRSESHGQVENGLVELIVDD